MAEVASRPWYASPFYVTSKRAWSNRAAYQGKRDCANCQGDGRVVESERAFG